MTVKPKETIRILPNVLNLIYLLYIYIYIYIYVKEAVEILRLRNNPTGSYQQIIKVLKIYGKLPQKLITFRGVVEILFISVDILVYFNCNCSYSSYTIWFVGKKRNCRCCRSWYKICCGTQRRCWW